MLRALRVKCKLSIVGLKAILLLHGSFCLAETVGESSVVVALLHWKTLPVHHLRSMLTAMQGLLLSEVLALDDVAATADLNMLLSLCLSPIPSQRPTAKRLLAGLKHIRSGLS
jgi:hypothetical protein